MTSTVLITGGTGFLGRRLVGQLARQGFAVRCLVRRGSDVDTLKNSLPVGVREQVNCLTGDLTDAGWLSRQCEGVDAVYHLAAAMTGGRARMLGETGALTRSLIDASIRAEVSRFILISSLAVYSAQAVRRGGVLDENTPLEPSPERRDPYTQSKCQQEVLAWRAHDEFGLPLRILRPGVIYGPGRTLITSRIGLTWGPVLVRMGGGQLLPYTFVENCADAVARAGQVPGIDGQAVNIVDDDLPTGTEILRLLRNRQCNVRSLWIPQLAIRPLAALNECCSRLSRGRIPEMLTRYKSDAIWKPLRYSNEKAKRILGWKPQIPTNEGLQRTITGETGIGPDSPAQELEHCV